MRRRTHSEGWVIGLILLTLGVLFLLDTTDVVDGVAATWWPLLLILWGGFAVLRELRVGSLSLPGTIVLLLGVGFLLENLEVLGEGWLGRYWPVVLLVVGAALILGALGWRRGAPPWAPKPHEDEDDWLDASAVMSGVKENVTSRAWRGGRASAVMGGVEIDLRGATPVPEGAVLRTSAFMGGVEVRVPESWNVVIRGTPLLGGFEDKRRNVPPPGDGHRPRLEITGTAVMGGVEVKD